MNCHSSIKNYYVKKGLRKHSLIGLNVNMHFVRYLSNHTRETFEMVMFESTKFPYTFIAILNIYIKLCLRSIKKSKGCFF